MYYPYRNCLAGSFLDLHGVREILYRTNIPCRDATSQGLVHQSLQAWEVISGSLRAKENFEKFAIKIFLERFNWKRKSSQNR